MSGMWSPNRGNRNPDTRGAGAMPVAGDLLFFGLAGQESYRLIVTQTEATEDGCTILRMADAAPQIDADRRHRDPRLVWAGSAPRSPRT